MLGVKAPRENAEKVRRYLKQAKMLDMEHKIFGKGKFIYIPVKALSGKAQKGIGKFKAEIAEARFERQKGMQAEGKGMLAANVEAKAYDVLGSIAIINRVSRAKELAKAIMRANKRVKTVVMKKGAVKGKYRTRGYSHVLGSRNFIAVYKENGCVFRFDIRKAFFSSRLAYERLRIASQVKDKEHVMVMFAGVGPFAIEIAKQHKNAKVVAIELNKYAYKSMLENIRLNKVEVEAVQGDVKDKAAKYKNWADRIVMPLPKSSSSFLDSALLAARNGCIVHYYAFGKAGEAIQANKEKIREFLEAHNAKPVFLFSRTVRPYSPSEIEVVIDFKIMKGKSKGKGKRIHKAGNTNKN